MPVLTTFDAAGEGIWTLPSGETIAAFLIEVLTVPPGGGVKYSTLPETINCGYYAVATADGPLMRRWINQTPELYPAPNQPLTSIYYNVFSGGSVRFSTIGTSSSGGGGDALQGAVVYDWDSSLNIPDSTWTTLANGSLKAHTNDSVIAATPDGGATAQIDGVYMATLFASWGSTVTAYQADVQFLVGGTPFGSVESAYMTIENNLAVTFTYVHNMGAGTNMVFQMYQNSGSTQPWNAVLSYALLAPA